MFPVASGKQKLENETVGRTALFKQVKLRNKQA
jgi:hypothetical protein